MAPIKNIVQDIASSERLRQQERISQTRADKTKKGSQAREGASVESRQDKVDISSAARELAETRGSDTARYQEMLAALRSENGDRIRDVQERIAQGEFNQPEVLAKVAQAISDLPQFRALSGGAPAGPESRGLRGDLAQRIRSGMYNSDEVLDRIAMNVLRDIGAA